MFATPEEVPETGFLKIGEGDSTVERDDVEVAIGAGVVIVGVVDAEAGVGARTGTEAEIEAKLAGGAEARLGTDGKTEARTGVGTTIGDAEDAIVEQTGEGMKEAVVEGSGTSFVRNVGLGAVFDKFESGSKEEICLRPSGSDSVAAGSAVKASDGVGV